MKPTASDGILCGQYFHIMDKQLMLFSLIPMTVSQTQDRKYVSHGSEDVLQVLKTGSETSKVFHSLQSTKYFAQNTLIT